MNSGSVMRTFLVPQGPSLQGEQTALPAAGRAPLAATLSPGWLPCPAAPGGELGTQGSLLVSSSSPPNCQAVWRNKEVVAMEWGPGVLSILLLCLGAVYTPTVGTEFTPVRICRASASQGLQQLLHFIATLAQFPS